MSEWAARRFWTGVDVTEAADGFGVSLDDRPVKTPAKATLILPTRSLAEKVAEEWREVEGRIDPTRMPWTRSSNSAIDKVRPQRAEIEDHLAGYARTDLVCYRADAPEVLVRRQSETWDPLLGWIASRYDARLATTAGVMPVAQSDGAVARLTKAMSAMSEFELTGFHDMVTLSGSFVIALATSAGRDSPEALWQASRVDEDFQIEEWGADEEAAETAALRKEAFLHAVSFFHFAKKSGRDKELRH